MKCSSQAWVFEQLNSSWFAEVVELLAGVTKLEAKGQCGLDPTGYCPGLLLTHSYHSSWLVLPHDLTTVNLLTTTFSYPKYNRLNSLISQNKY